MEDKFKQNLLYDFYGELLTEHQRNVYEDAVYEDLSLSEIAEEYNISRQGVHDLIKRCDKLLLEYENKLHLAERFQKAKKYAETISNIAAENKNDSINDNSHDFANDAFSKIEQLSQELLEIL